MASVDIIIVNWNTGRQLRECLESVSGADMEGVELGRVVIVDNASSDGSERGLDGIRLPLRIIYNRENRGFAAACNQGALGSCSDYILFLNPDTVLFRNSLAVPVVFMESEANERIGVVGIQLIGDDGQPDRACARFPTPARLFSRIVGLYRLSPRLFPSYRMADWDHAEDREVDHVMGAFFMVRSKVFETLGGFDERFFVYMEDLDFSYRMRREGWSSYYLTGAKVFHRGGGASDRARAERLFYSAQSKILYAFRHFSVPAAALLLLGSLVIEPLVRFAFALANGSGTRLIETVKGYAALWRALPRLIREAHSDR